MALWLQLRTGLVLIPTECGIEFAYVHRNIDIENW